MTRVRISSRAGLFGDLQTLIKSDLRVSNCSSKDAVVVAVVSPPDDDKGESTRLLVSAGRTVVLQVQAP
eukprot:scaffold5865_cov186-Amphora_coffeaeformis.AAC.18